MSYNKSFYVFQETTPLPVTIRNYRVSDIPEMIDIQRECFPPPFPSELLWNEEQLQSHIERFPEGALCAEADGRLIGSMTGLITQFDPDHPQHRWEDVTDHGYIRNHQPDGNSLYVVDISVRPDYRKYGIGKWLMQSMYETVVQLRLERLLGGGRMPGYHRFADRMTPEAYADAVMKGELRDPVITFLLRCGRTPVVVARDYLEDEESCNHALLMEWKNPFLST
ncbi:GNAT family N-acetyltransferase [Paenibacillus guangzhouensis]|uniref:GNAT family N-acetyltransferase n=1 Tax=Paenibacillus guangzhouensis TaxID=1473112 RepID=UPI001266C48F|nr:GNAT family N-acetyltransferase [Paenibacillus guangzhouensis]